MSHPSFRFRYLATDVQYNPNSLQFFPPHFASLDSVHKRFFVSNTTLNHIDVFDATTESEIGSIVVPEPWGIDVTPDGSKMYAATAFGDVYLIDPSALEVLQRFPSSTIGPQGYIATQVFALADGQLALLGAMEGQYLDGSQTFAVWNPSNNELQTVYPGDVPSSQWSGGNIGQITVSADRSKVLVAPADGGSVMLYDPLTSTGLGAPCSSVAADILPTPDGEKIFVVGPQGGVDIYDANTLGQIGNFQAPATAYGGVLSYDGSTLFIVDQAGNVYAFDTSSFTEKGWVPSFEILDLQYAIVPSVVDPTGLMIGPMGHGVGFLDTTQINPGTKGTQFSVSFLTPSVGSSAGGSSIETNYVGPALQQATMYVGNAVTGSVHVSPDSLTTTAPKSTFAGVADFTVTLPDKSIGMMPEDYSYGPTIVEVSTNAASAEGGMQGAIFGYGFGNQPSDVQLSIGGQAATASQLFTGAPIFPYPFPIQTVLFTIPPGMAGSSADVTITIADGMATASGSFHYVPAGEPFPLVNSSLMQGIYDPFRGVLYFTDRAQIDVFSPSSGSWLAPITLPNTTISTRLVGISLSPNGNTLAVSDPGDNAIYVVKPSVPASVKSFSGVGLQGVPYGLAVTNSGVVYFGTYAQSISSPGGLGKLDSNTGQVSAFPLGTLEDGDTLMRILLSPDGTQIYANEQGYSWTLETSDDALSEGIQVSNAGNRSEEMAISGDGSVLLTSGLLTDADLNVTTGIAYVDRDTWLPVATFGQKLDFHGTLAFQPLSDGIDVLDGTTGLLQYRVMLPIELSSVYDSLAIDDNDQLLFGITASGIVQLDLSSLPAANSFTRRIPRRAKTASKPQSSRNPNRIRQEDLLNRPMLRHRQPPPALTSSASPMGKLR
jgi:streptogramin lyase